MSLPQVSNTACTVMVLLVLGGCFDASMVQQGFGGLPFGFPGIGIPGAQDSRIAQLERALAQYDNEERYQQAVPVAEEYLRLFEETTAKSGKTGGLPAGVIAVSPAQPGRVGSLFAARLLVASIHRKAGNITRAEELYLSGLQALRASPFFGPAHELHATRELVRMYVDTGQAEKALQLLDDFAKRHGAQAQQDVLTSTILYTTLGDVALKQNCWNEAVKQYETGLQYAEKAAQSSAQSGSGFNQVVSIFASLRPLAETKWKGIGKTYGLRSPRSTADETPEDYRDEGYAGIRVMNNLAYSYYRAGQIDKLKPLYQEHFTKFRRQHSFGKTDVALGREPGGSALGGEGPIMATLLFNFARLLAAAGFQTEARMALNESMALQTKLIKNGFASTLFNEDDILEIAVHTRQYEGMFINYFYENQYGSSVLFDVFDKWLKFKGISFDVVSIYTRAIARDASTKMQNKLDEYTAGLGELTRLGERQQSVNFQTLFELIQKLEGIRMELQALVKPMLEQLSRDTLDGASITEVNKALDVSVVYLDIARIASHDFANLTFGPEQYYAFIMLPGQQPTVSLVKLGDAQSIDGLITRYRKQLQTTVEARTAPRAAALNAIGLELYRTLIQPLEAAFAGRTKLIVNPDGELNLLPLDVLTTPDGRYLLEQYEITYVTTSRDITGWRQGAKAATGPAVFIGNPDYGAIPQPEGSGVKKRGLAVSAASAGPQAVVQDFQALPETLEEVKAIAATLQANGWPSVLVFTGQQAVEEVLWQAPAPRVLHIATHGYFLENTNIHLQLHLDTVAMQTRPLTAEIPNPILRSGIALAGANVALHNKTDVGLVYPQKLIRLNLDPTELVVLSACDTGVGDVQVGEGVFGLKRAFLLAGAKTLVSSLWKVPSDETTELMIEFYKAMTRGERKSMALKNAKLHMAKKYSNPFVWGAFILTGNPS